MGEGGIVGDRKNEQTQQEEAGIATVYSLVSRTVDNVNSLTVSLLLNPDD